ncbi:MAG: PDZ domain-containing protein [Phycisphaeraceae bacterium]|nr:PDZ domain-containing protein [Phycisphaeraceae bacterium]
MNLPHRPALLGLLLLLIAPVAIANQDLSLTQLGHEDPAVRQATERALMLQADLPDDQIASAFGQSDDVEVHHRLLRIAQHHFIRRQAEQLPAGREGAIGVITDIVRPISGESERTGAVLVVQTFPGFPGHVHFQLGDLILAVNGKTLTGTRSVTHFSQTVRAHDPGETITFTINRDGQTRDIDVTLSSVNRLENSYQLENGVVRLLAPLERLWQHQRKKIVPESSEEPLNPEDYNPTDR